MATIILRRLLLLTVLLFVTACDAQEQTEPLRVNTVTLQLSTGETVKVPAQQVISSGGNHTLIIKENGTVWAFGGNEYGQLGNGTTEASLEPVQVKGLKDIVKVSAGDDFSVALDAQGDVWTWGINEEGQLGDDTIEPRWLPTKIAQSINDVAAGAFTSYALHSDGQFLGWGDNLTGVLGPRQSLGKTLLTPTPLPEPTNVTGISRQGLGTVIIRGGGQVWAWGDAALTSGKFDYSDTEYPEPERVPKLTNICEVAVGIDFVIALGCGGQVWSWGDNWIGQLGIDSSEPRFEPVRVHNLENVVAVSAYGYHALALDTLGQVWGWGKSDFYQAPDVYLQLTDEPTKFSKFKDSIAVSAGADITTILDTSGQVWTVGYSGVGDFFEDEEIVYEEPHLVMTR